VNKRPLLDAPNLVTFLAPLPLGLPVMGLDMIPMVIWFGIGTGTSATRRRVVGEAVVGERHLRKMLAQNRDY
jgi:hypothetical protein